MNGTAPSKRVTSFSPFVRSTDERASAITGTAGRDERSPLFGGGKPKEGQL